MATSIPFDVLCEILDLSLPPKFLVSPSDSQDKNVAGPWRRSINLKCTLSVVCKAWRAAAIRLLFSDVVIGSAGQAESFFDSVRSSSFLPSSTDVSRFVKSVDYALVDDDKRELCLVNYQQIRQALPNLKHVALELPRPRADLASKMSQLALTSLTITLRANQTSGVSASDITSTLRAISSTLAHLHLILYSFSPGDNNDSGELLLVDSAGAPKHRNHIDFKKLGELELTLPPLHQDVRGLIEHWSMPRMTRLTVHSPYHLIFTYAWSLVQIHRHQITYFHLDISDLNERNTWENVRRCLKDCTSLRHLVLTVLPDRKGLRNDSIEFIDVWNAIDYKSLDGGASNTLRLRGGARSRQTPRKSTGGVAPRKRLMAVTLIDEPNIFPRLREVRILDETLRHLSRLPLDVLPDRVLCKEDEFSMRYEGIHVWHGVGKLVHVPEVVQVIDNEEVVNKR